MRDFYTSVSCAGRKNNRIGDDSYKGVISAYEGGCCCTDKSIEGPGVLGPEEAAQQVGTKLKRVE